MTTPELTLMDAQSKFHCVSDYTFNKVKDQLQQGMEEVSDSEHPLSDAEDVAFILEYGLAWGIEEPEECLGYICIRVLSLHSDVKSSSVLLLNNSLYEILKDKRTKMNTFCFEESTKF